MTVLLDERATLSSAALNDLPDSAFAYIEPGGTKDSAGRTTPRSLRHFAIHDAAHVRNALARIGQGAKFGKEAMPKVKAAAKRMGISVGQSNSRTPDIDVIRAMCANPEIRAAKAGTGSLGTLVVRFSPFNTWYEVNSKFEGRFMERTIPGTFADTVTADRGIMRSLFDHGHDPQIGNKVLGPIIDLREDADSPVGEVDLMDTSYNRDLLPGLLAGVYGSSFRMHVLADDWIDRPQRSAHNPEGLPERTITRTKTLEFGPVTFPASPTATAAMRSMTDQFYEQLRARDASAYETAVRAARAMPAMPAMPAMDDGGDQGETPEDAGRLAQAVDVALDAAMDILAKATLPPELQPALAFLTLADATLDDLLETLGVPDLPDPSGRSTDFTVRPELGSGGGDPGTQPGTGDAPTMSIRQRLDDGALRARKVIK